MQRQNKTSRPVQVTAPLNVPPTKQAIPKFRIERSGNFELLNLKMDIDGFYTINIPNINKEKFLFSNIPSDKFKELFESNMLDIDLQGNPCYTTTLLNSYKQIVIIYDYTLSAKSKVKNSKVIDALSYLNFINCFLEKAINNDFNDSTENFEKSFSLFLLNRECTFELLNEVLKCLNSCYTLENFADFTGEQTYKSFISLQKFYNFCNACNSYLINQKNN